MPGFGSRGGLRQMGVIRKDEPMDKPTCLTRVWHFRPAAHEQEKSVQAEPAQNPVDAETNSR